MKAFAFLQLLGEFASKRQFRHNEFTSYVEHGRALFYKVSLHTQIVRSVS